MIKKLILTCTLVLFCTSARAQDHFEYNFELAFENLNFIFQRNNHSLNDQESFDLNSKLVYDNQSYFKVNLEPRLRIDVLDKSRLRFIPNEAFLSFYNSSWQFNAGLMTKPQGVATFFNPTDVITRKDMAENAYTPETLGELILDLKWMPKNYGPFNNIVLEAMVLPLFQKTPLPLPDMRYALNGTRGLVPYQIDTTQESPSFSKGFGAAFKVSASFKQWDMSLLYHHGPEHSPGYFFTTNGTGALRLRPFYYTLDTLGMNHELAFGNLTLRFETALKLTVANAYKTHVLAGSGEDVVPNSYWQYVPSLSYNFENLATGNLIVTIEYLGENTRRTNVLEELRPFKNDLLLGGTYHFNNTRLTQIQVGLVKDLGNAEFIGIIDASSQLIKNLKLQIQALFLSRSNDLNQPLSFFDNNSYLMTRLSYSFGSGF